MKQDVSKGAFYTRIQFIAIFGFADQGKAIYGLRYIINLKHKENTKVVTRRNVVAEAKDNIEENSLSMEKIIQSLANQQLVLYQILTEIPTGLCNEESSVFRKAIIETSKTAYRTFGLGRRKRKK